MFCRPLQLRLVTATPPPSPSEINVVFIVLDATAARYLSCYGNKLETTPNIDRLAREATVFERAYSQAAWTLPSVASYMTGRYPPARGKIGKAFLERPIASLLLEAGLETAGFSENPYVTRQFGIAKGFSGLSRVLSLFFSRRETVDLRSLG